MANRVFAIILKSRRLLLPLPLLGLDLEPLLTMASAQPTTVMEAVAHE
jgi:hypothetical protein